MRAAKTDETPLVSVLMFVYNESAYVEQAIRSVLGQAGNYPAEIIIHDDASTDGSREIIEKYAKKYPDLIIPILQDENQMQQGVNFIGRFIMPRVRGKYLAYCEGDDYWTDSRKLAIQLKILEEHPKYSAVCHNCKVVDEQGRRKKPVKKFYPFSQDAVYTLKELCYESRMPGQTASVVMRCCIVSGLSAEKEEQFRSIRYCVGDRQRTLLMLLNGPVLCLRRTMSAYRYVTSSGSSWNASTKGKNMAGNYFVQEFDFRNFAKNCFDTELKNNYVLFGTGLMACLRFIRNPDENNTAQYQKVLSVFEGKKKDLVLFLAGCFPGALLTLPEKALQELRWRI